MASYVEYTYYANTYLGTAITSASFGQMALRASAVIDHITYNRVAAIISTDEDAEQIDKIKMAVCAVADEMQRQSESGPEIASERVGNHSVTYADTADKKLTEDDRLVKSAKVYLADTGLMYKGFYADEHGSNLI